MLNRIDQPHPEREAVVEYLDGDFRVIRPGTYVICASTGAQIPMEELRYWNVDRQEAYRDPAAKLQSLPRDA